MAIKSETIAKHQHLIDLVAMEHQSADTENEFRILFHNCYGVRQEIIYTLPVLQEILDGVDEVGLNRFRAVVESARKIREARQK